MFFRQVSVVGPTNLFGAVLMLSRYSCVFSFLAVSLNDIGHTMLMICVQEVCTAIRCCVFNGATF